MYFDSDVLCFVFGWAFMDTIWSCHDFLLWFTYGFSGICGVGLWKIQTTIVIFFVMVFVNIPA
jgi:hypothetical protein